VAGGRAVPEPARGGEAVQALRDNRARVVTGAAALAAAGALALWAVAAADTWEAACTAAAAFGVAALAVGLVFGVAVPVGIGIGAVGVAYAIAIAWTDELAPGAVVFGPALLVAAELAYWSLEHRVRISDERPLVARRVTTLGFVVVMSLAVGVLAVGTTAVPVREGVLVLAAGAAAAVAVVALVGALARAER
jgi:hypothetical protein